MKRIRDQKPPEFADLNLDEVKQVMDEEDQKLKQTPDAGMPQTPDTAAPKPLMPQMNAGPTA